MGPHHPREGAIGGKGGPLQSIKTVCRELCNKSSAVAEMGDHGHNRHGPKEGGCCAPFPGGAGSPSNTMGRGLLPYQVASSSSHSAIIDIGRKLGGACALFSWGAGSPCNTKSPGPRPTSVTSGIWIHPAICPQQTWAENWGCAPLGRVSSVPI